MALCEDANTLGDEAYLRRAAVTEPRLKWERSQEGDVVAFNARSGKAYLCVDNRGLDGRAWSLNAYLPERLDGAAHGFRINGLLIEILDARLPLTNDANHALCECERMTRDALLEICGELLAGDGSGR